MTFPRHTGTHTRQNQTKEVGGSHDFTTEEVWFQESQMPNPDYPHLPTLAFGGGGSLLSPVQASRHSLA